MLETGTKIRVTKADDQGGPWGVGKALDAEWNGTVFVGCIDGRGGHWLWSRGTLRELVRCDCDGPRYTNIDGMIEQLIVEGHI